MRILITRPRTDAAALADELAGLGHTALIAPLMEIMADAGALLSLAGVQALLTTSANGVRALAAHPQGAAARSLPLFAVGAATAKAARRAGFTDIHIADGDVAALAALARRMLRPDKGRLIHIAGNVRAGDLKGLLENAGFIVETAVLYRAEAATRLPPVADTAIRDGAVGGVVLYSPRTAHIYADLVMQAGLGAHIRLLHHFCLSPAVAAALSALPLAPARRHVAGRPTQAALVALIEDVAGED